MIGRRETSPCNRGRCKTRSHRPDSRRFGEYETSVPVSPRTPWRVGRGLRIPR